MSNFKKLNVWRESHSLTIECYNLTKKFPDDEKFGVVSQIRRASSSIPANIAEGSGTSYKKEFLRFLSISRGSCSELEYFLLLSHDLGYINDDDYKQINHKVIGVNKMITGLIKKINDSDISTT